MNPSFTPVLDTLFGDTLDWDENNPEVAYIPCPGRDKHTHRNGRKDCRVYLDGTPHVYCVHQSCEEATRELTENIRGALRAAGWEAPKATPEAKAKARAKDNNRRTYERVKANRDFVFEEFSWNLTQHANVSEIMTDAYHLFLQEMFEPNDILWCGQPWHVGDKHKDKFQRMSDRLKLPPIPRQEFICANPILPDAHVRNFSNLAARKYFIIEGDTCAEGAALNKLRCGAIFRYAMRMKPQLKLRAVVDSGNKSLHGWFEWAGEEVHNWCRAVLPALGADAATMRLSQPVRCPGALRNDTRKEQRLLWISK